MTRFLYISLLSAFLSACGGSSGSSSDGEKTQTYKFTLNGKLVNACGKTESFSDFEFFLQDENWQTLSKYQPDSRGKISFVISQAVINYTVVAKSKEANQTQGFDLESVAGINTESNVNYFARYSEKANNSDCQCVTQNLQLTHRPFTERTSVDSSAKYDGWTTIDDRTTEFNNVQVCQTSEGQWPLHSFSVIGKGSLDDTVGAVEFFNDFLPTSDQLWQATAVEVIDYLHVFETIDTDITTSQMIQNIQHFESTYHSENTSLVTFKNHPYVSETDYVANSVRHYPDDIIALGKVSVETSQRITSTAIADTFLARASDHFTLEQLQSIANLNQNNTYDYATFSGYPYALFSFDLTKASNSINTPINWTVISAQQGVLPFAANLEGYQNVVGNIEDIVAMDIQLIKSAGITDQQAFINIATSQSALSAQKNIELISASVQ